MGQEGTEPTESPTNRRITVSFRYPDGITRFKRRDIVHVDNVHNVGYLDKLDNICFRIDDLNN